MVAAVRVSIFDILIDIAGKRVPIITCSKATLVHLSHILEDTVLHNQLPALIFTGFQKTSYWEQETRRYRELSRVAHQVCIFAGEKLPPESNASSLHVQLTGDDPLRQEWFLLILSEKFSVILCGKDNQVDVSREELRQFDTILSFDPDAINLILDRMESVIERYRPERLSQLQEARRRYPPQTAENEIVLHLFTEMMRFEEDLQRQLFKLHEEQLQISEALRREKDFNELLIQSAPVLFFAIDSSKKILLINSYMLYMLGYQHEELAGQDFVDILIAKKDQAVFNEVVSRLTRESTVEIVEVNIRARNGTLIPVEWHSSSIFSSQGNLEFAFGAGFNLTERKELESERLKVRVEQARVHLLENFIRDASHDLKNPLAVLQNTVYILKNLKDPAHLPKTARILDRQVSYLDKQIQSMLTLSRLDSQNEYEFTIQNINSLVKDTAARLSHFFSQHNCTLEMELTPDLPPVYLDVPEMERVLSNLLDNAVNYGGPGRIICRTNQKDEQIVLEIQDEGPGIPADEQQIIFERFYRQDKSRPTDRGSTGLGLSIVKKIIEIHQGQIEVESTEGAGTTFRVLLPALT